ncbi:MULTISPECIES: FGGY-family carbohydrate kinase [unclassified Aureimonas]|uniref:FGGY-family carbohydrate kinase n=1 Tax=unclassified Aureimonas TaxID=2615206 RepID=UPI0006FC0FAE|nr:MULTISPECIES: FGGY family carbohydrate kinase [unclassified Aureimonas]KQT63308.1 hypothetical protein ASG62_22535 [Aureimonas sp. Leaf427]KQT80112.1 hypothetical protein ASG54_08230 [Aureimonas sp. Leaf460]
MTQLCCGLDIGSTNLKAVLVDTEGRVRWAKAVATPRIEDGIGPATSAEDLLRSAEDLIVEGWREVGEGLPLRAVATAGVGEDGLPLTGDLVPVATAVPWFDERARAEAGELARGDAASERLGLHIDRFRTVAKWLWLSRHRPQDIADGRIWIALTDYPAVAWSGTPFVSETLAARTAAYDVYGRNWHAPMLEAAKAPRLPPVVPAGTVVGTMRPGRLRRTGAADAETVVVAGGHDHPVAASYIRRFEPDAVVDSMGTAEVVYGEAEPGAVRPLDPRLAFSVPVLGSPGLSCLGVFELASALAPYRSGVHGDLVSALLSGETPKPVPAPAKRSLVGQDAVLPSASNRNAALVATQEAVRGTIRRSASLIEAVGATGDVYTTGGWSRSDRFLQMRADMFGRTIHRFDENELTGAGAALIAWAAISPRGLSALARPAVRSFAPATATNVS